MQLASETVLVTHYIVSDVAHIQVNMEDEEYLSGGYLFQVDVGLMLFVSELDIDSDLIDGGHFPCRSFEINRLADTDQIIHIECTGTPLKPTLTRLLDAIHETVLQETRLRAGTIDQLDSIIEPINMK